MPSAHGTPAIDNLETDIIFGGARRKFRVFAPPKSLYQTLNINIRDSGTNPRSVTWNTGAAVN